MVSELEDRLREMNKYSNDIKGKMRIDQGDTIKRLINKIAESHSEVMELSR